MGLPRHRRLTRTADFAAVRKSGRSWSGRYLILATLVRPELPHAVAGFTVTRRVGNAVVRNRVRRQLREIAREFLPRIDARCLIVTIPRPGAARADFAGLRREWEKLALRAALLSGPPSPPPPPTAGSP